VTNFPPCLKGKEGFSGIRPDQKKITGKVIHPCLTVHFIDLPFLLYSVMFVSIGSSMLVIDGKYNNEDGMSTESM
jgi:hypothetical protein